MPVRRLAALLLTLVSSWSLAGRALAAGPIIVNIDNPSFRRLVGAIPDFHMEGLGDPELEKYAKAGPEELGRLLVFSGLFNIMAPAGYAEAVKAKPVSPPPPGGVKGLEGVDLPAWKTLGVESLTVGEIGRDGANLVISLRTIDIPQGRLMVGKKYSGVPPSQLKRVMAKYADRILEAYTGKPGIFSSRLVFVGRQSKGSNKQIYLADVDGGNVVQVTNEKAVHLSPAFSADGRFITYTSFEDGNPDLFIYEIASGKKRKLSGRKGLNSGSNWAPNGKLVAFTGSVEGDADIFVIGPDGAKFKPLIRGQGLDVDPTFSPDGKWMAFVSGRFGNPHIFRAELKWDGPTEVRVVADKRLTYAGWYNATPSWTPESDKIAFAGYDRDIDRFDLFMMNPDGTQLERLTIRSGDNERPSFAPNGQLIAFQSNRTDGRDVKGVAQLWIMNRDGSSQRQLQTGLYEAQQPTWGPPMD
jgi:TolB protein